MTRLLTSGAESGTFAGEGASAIGDCTVDAAAARRGSYGFRTPNTNTNHSIYWTPAMVAQRNYFARCYLRKSAHGPQGMNLWALDASLAYVFWCGFAASGELVLVDRNGSICAQTPVLDPTEWHRIAVRFRVGTLATNGQLELRYAEGDDDLAVAGSSAAANCGTAAPAYVGIGGLNQTMWGLPGVVLDQDDLALNDEVGAAPNNSWPGAVVPIARITDVDTGDALVWQYPGYPSSVVTGATGR